MDNRKQTPPVVDIETTIGGVKYDTYFKFPDAVRRLIYTTNAIEGFNHQLRKATKSKSVFSTDDSLLKIGDRIPE